MANQWYFLMILLAPIADGIITWLMRWSNVNTRKTNIMMGVTSLCLFIVLWVIIINSPASWTPRYFGAIILFWVGWHRLLAGLRYYGRPYGRPANPTPDFFTDNSVVQVLGCYEMPNWYTRQPSLGRNTLNDLPYKHKGEQLVIAVSESSGLDPRLLIVDQAYAPGYYLAIWNGRQWDLQPTRKPNSRPTTTH